MKISIDGGGITRDVQLWEGHRFRLSTTAEPAGDVTVYVEKGKLHLVGQYATVHAERIEPNHVALHTVRPGDPS